MRTYDQGRPYPQSIVNQLVVLLREENNVLRVQKRLESHGNKFSYPYLLGVARKHNIVLKRGRPCKKKKF